MKKILFVCSMNTVRSAMAEIITNELYRNDFIATSAGVNADTGSNMDYDARLAMQRAGYSAKKLEAFHSRRINESMISDADQVIAVSGQIRDALLYKYPEYADKIYAFSRNIYVPAGENDIGFDECFLSVCEEVENILYPGGSERWKPKSEK